MPSRYEGLKPHGTNIITRRMEAPAMAGSIYIPEEHRRIEAEARVLAVGNGKESDGTYRQMDLEVGDRVVFYPSHGTEFKHQGETLLFLDEADIIVVLKEKNPAMAG